MRVMWISLMPLLLAACATEPRAAAETPPSPAIAAASPTKLVETRYEIRGYREAADPAIRHEAHAVYRRTRVPVTAGDNFETVPRETYPPASIAPLPPSAELAAELATQKAITAELRAMQASMAETAKRVQEQYAALVRESAEARKVHEQLEAERSRMHAAAATAAPQQAGAAGAPAEAKW